MTVRMQAARVSPLKNSPGRLLPRCAALAVVIAAACPTALLNSALSAEPAKKPNIIFILADDKYESTGPKLKKRAISRQNTGFPA